jgi:hypothetical protein
MLHVWFWGEGAALPLLSYPTDGRRRMMFFRSVVAVIVGYAVFATSAGALFQLSGQDPHGEATVPFMAFAGVYGVAFALLGGYVSGWIASRSPFAHGLIVAAMVASGAAVSLLATVGHGYVWSQVTALTAMAPAAALGGYLRGWSLRHAKKA